MELTNRQISSDIATEIRALNIDDRVSSRWILSVLKDKTRSMLKQDLESRRLFKISSIWQTIDCVELCEVPYSECACDIPNCKVVMKSKIKIPRAFESNYGTMVKVVNIGGTSEFIQTSLTKYIDIKARNIDNPKAKYFWIDNGYIFIPDSMVETVMVRGLFENPEEVDKLNDPIGSECLKPLDALFPCPSHLVDAVKKETVLEFAKIFKGLQEDQTPNQNSNIK